MRQIYTDIIWDKKAVVFFAATIVLVVIGPFGTYQDFSLAERFVYWTALMIGVGFFMHIIINLLLIHPKTQSIPKLGRLVIGAALAALPGAAVVEFVNAVFRPSDITMISLASVWWKVTLLGSIIGGIEYVEWTPPAQTTAPQQLTPFHKRLSHETGHDIISLSMQDHYVEVTSTQGKELILMRFSDALDEISNWPGAQVHRSHWVAQKHIGELQKASNKKIVTLSDGRHLPVSSTYVDDLNELLKGK